MIYHVLLSLWGMPQALFSLGKKGPGVFEHVRIKKTMRPAHPQCQRQRKTHPPTANDNDDGLEKTLDPAKWRSWEKHSRPQAGAESCWSLDAADAAQSECVRPYRGKVIKLGRSRLGVEQKGVASMKQELNL